MYRAILSNHDYVGANKAYCSPRKSIVYAMIRGASLDNQLTMDDRATYSPVHLGMFAHVKSRVLTPFAGKFDKQYFFRPFKFKFERNAFGSKTESVYDQICSILIPIFGLFDPSATLSFIYVINSLVAFCSSMYHLALAISTQDNEHTHKAQDSFKQCASNLTIALFMPIVASVAGSLDSIRLMTRSIATIIDRFPDSENIHSQHAFNY